MTPAVPAAGRTDAIARKVGPGACPGGSHVRAAVAGVAGSAAPGLWHRGGVDARIRTRRPAPRRYGRTAGSRRHRAAGALGRGALLAEVRSDHAPDHPDL